MKLLWLTDLHLHDTQPHIRRAFLARLSEETYDAAVVSGDISVARRLTEHLGELARACAPRPVHFVLGNHDFFGGGFADVDRAVTECCQKHANLRHLGQGEVIRLSSTTALIGHRGWADGRAWGGKWTSRRNPDREGIRDLRAPSAYATFLRMKKLGLDSGSYFRKVLPYALTAYRHVVIVTHVPPFARAVRFNGRPCEASLLPHYVNASAGAVIQRIGEHFPQTKITVLCGHAHHGNTVKVTDNLEVRVGQARKGAPVIQEIIES